MEDFVAWNKWINKYMSFNFSVDTDYYSTCIVSKINIMNHLSHWVRDKITAILQTTFLNAFS